MYVIFSLIAMLFLSITLFIDKVLVKEMSNKFIQLVKGVIFFLFSLLLLAANNSFNKLLDFHSVEWLFFIILVVLSVGIYFLYNFIIKKENATQFSLYTSSNVLAFANIFFLIFSSVSMIRVFKPLNIVFLVIELILILGVIFISLFINKENNKENMIFMSILSLGFVGILIMKDMLLPRQGLDVIYFWATAIILIFNAIRFFIDKEEILELKKYRWQDYVIAFFAPASAILVYLFANRAASELTARYPIVNMIIGISFIVFVVFDLVKAIKNKQDLKLFVKDRLFTLISGGGLLLAFVCHIVCVIA